MNAPEAAPGVVSSAGKYYCSVKDVMDYLGCKQNKAYTIIRTLRKELIEKGKLTAAYPPGKVPKKYFLEKCMIEE